MKSRTVGINCDTKHKIIIDGERHEIRVKGNKPAWVKLKEFINTIPKDGLFTRGQMLDAVYNVGNNLKGTDTAADYYKCHLNTLGFITTDRPGVYVKHYDVPMHLSIKKVQEAARSLKSWRGWFIPIHEQLGIPEDQCPNMVAVA